MRMFVDAFPSCILHYRHRISSNTCFNRVRGRRENEGSIRLMLKLTYHTARLEVRGITCTHDDDVDDRIPKTAFFLGYASWVSQTN